MIMLMGFVLGAFGLLCLFGKKTFLGLLVGTYLLTLGATTSLVAAGLISGVDSRAQIFSIFVVVGGIAQMVVGYAFAIRLFFLHKNVSIKELTQLRN